MLCGEVLQLAGKIVKSFCLNCPRTALSPDKVLLLHPAWHGLKACCSQFVQSVSHALPSAHTAPLALVAMLRPSDLEDEGLPHTHTSSMHAIWP